MVDQNDGLLREVEEELRRERLENLWQQYGTYILAAAALFVATVGGIKYWQARQIAEAQSMGAQYQSAMTTLANGKTEDAIKVFDGIANSGQDGYKALAALQIAGAQLKQGNTEDAKAAFDKVAADHSVDPLLRDFATLQAVAVNVGDTDFTDVQNRLNRLSGVASPWRANARELIALSAFNAKKYDVARAQLRSIVSDPSAAAGVIQRANTLLASIAAIEIGAGEKDGAGAPESAKQASGTDAGGAGDQDVNDKGASASTTKPETQ